MVYEFCAPTFDRVEEVEKRAVGNLFGDSADGATAFVLLLFLDRFHGHILPLVPIYHTAMGRMKTIYCIGKIVSL